MEKLIHIVIILIREFSKECYKTQAKVPVITENRGASRKINRK
jgi:hypothetical protein